MRGPIFCHSVISVMAALVLRRITTMEPTPEKKKRGRPRKDPEAITDSVPKRGRGRPRKNPEPVTTTAPPPGADTTPKRGRGRPPLTEEEKKRRNELRAVGVNPVRPKFGQEYVDPGDNSRFLIHSMAVMSMPPIEIADVKQVEQRIHDYMALCAEHDMKPTVKGLCNALRVTRQALFDWRHGNFRANTHQAVILRAYDLLEELWENYMQNGKINPVSGIFLGKNNFGYADKQEYVVTPNTGSIPDAADVATIEAKYAELPDCESD